LGKNKEADFLLKNYVVYVIPMVNPDGVAFGHYRTNLAGKDLNRKWNATEKDINTPEVSSIKAFIQ
jgi:murein tripeptide amidase MpaA